MSRKTRDGDVVDIVVVVMVINDIRERVFLCCTEVSWCNDRGAQWQGTSIRVC